MRNFIAVGTAVVLTITSSVAGQGYCRGETHHDGVGNPFCDAVKHIHYTGVSATGTYNKVVGMTGCQTAPQTYGGPMAPYDEEVGSLDVLRGETQTSSVLWLTLMPSLALHAFQWTHAP